MSAIERYELPDTVDHAADILRGGDVTVLAGGTDLMLQSQAGRVALGTVLMNIRRVAGLAGIAAEGDCIRIGALTTITDLLEHDLIRHRLPVLSDAADKFASGQIRNMGTVGGNICNASPAGDTLVPLLVLDAEVELVSKPDGHLAIRQLPLRDFFIGPGRTARRPDELLTAVLVPLPPPGFRARFAKLGIRPALDISIVSVAVGGVVADGTIAGARVAFGAVGPRPLRGTGTEAALEGQPLAQALIEAAACTARDEVTPIDDLRATAWYRREMIHSLTKKVLTDVAAA